MTQPEKVIHLFEPVYDGNSRVLILGTFPSVKSRENLFFYGHPRNRFWELMGRLTDEQKPITIEDKKKLLLRHNIAIWDVIASCTITGSSDSSIKDVVPTDISVILKKANISRIYGNGAKACQLYGQYLYPRIKKNIIKLPSSSPANAAFSIDALYEQWKDILEYLY